MRGVRRARREARRGAGGVGGVDTRGGGGRAIMRSCRPGVFQAWALAGSLCTRAYETTDQTKLLLITSSLGASFE
jgi:hypothetical protein